MREAEIFPKSLDRLAPLIGPQRAEQLDQAARQAREALAGRTVWNVDATAEGGGVAELLTSLLAYGRAAGVDTRWLVLDGDADFFALTKRLHNLIHGVAGDGRPLGERDREHYLRVLEDNLGDLTPRLRPGDVVVLHDPQTAGLVPRVADVDGVRVVWRSHIGWDARNEHTDAGWAFLRSDVERAEVIVFSRRQFCPDWVPAEKLRVIAPSIDPFAAKNADLEPARTRAVLAQAGLLADGEPTDDLGFVRADGTPGQVRPHSDLLVDGVEPLPADVRLVMQVSRWDRLKDMGGLLRGFTDALPDLPDDAHLMLVGPEVSGVSDDPEGAEVLEECTRQWRDLPDAARARTHLVTLPMDDVDENAHLTNALRSQATVLVQKSLVEGFGLTLTEAMWKGRPVIASAVGGLADQVTDEVDGLLLDPEDLDGFGRRLVRLLSDDELATRLGRAARDRVHKDFLVDRHLREYADLLVELVATESRR